MLYFLYIMHFCIRGCFLCSLNIHRTQNAVKGLRRNVIEINDTDNENIERILVFLKPQAADVAIGSTRAQATQLLQELEIKKVRRFGRKQLWTALAVAAIAAVTALVVLL